MKLKIIFPLLTVVLLASGTLLYYLYGYKDSLLIKGSAYLLIIFGWLFITIFLMSLHPEKPGAAQPGSHVWQRIKYGLYFVVYPVWLAALIAGFLVLDTAKDNRVNTFLALPDAAYTTATVTNIEERRTRSTSHVYAVIEYRTTTETVHQAIEDDAHLYSQGQQVTIKYAPAHPDMFSVATPLLPGENIHP